MSIIKKRLLLPLLACASLIALQAPATAGTPPAIYECTGTLSGKGNVPVVGSVTFGLGENNVFNACFNLDVAFGCNDFFSGGKDELDLGFISFWSFQETPLQGGLANGSGIRLLFGLFIFGTIENGPETISFSGIFAGAPNSDGPLHLSSSIRPATLAAREPRGRLRVQ